MFGVAKQIALKMVIKSTYILQKNFVIFTNLNERAPMQSNSWIVKFKRKPTKIGVRTMATKIGEHLWSETSPRNFETINVWLIAAQR